MDKFIRVDILEGEVRSVKFEEEAYKYIPLIADGSRVQVIIADEMRKLPTHTCLTVEELKEIVEKMKSEIADKDYIVDGIDLLNDILKAVGEK